ncbi:hypothetical protein [Microcoleus vaginatus]|uniref:hypothetical protein n=1 Tax=Microcoleus vaginatus TaxID=119532 RepID=UPI0032AE3E4E
MKLKQYLGALLMAGSVLTFSFPAEAISGKQIPRSFKQAISLVKNIWQPITKAVVDDRAIDLITLETTKQITDSIHKDPTKLSQLVSHSAVQPTPRTKIEEEASQDIPKYVKDFISVGVSITVANDAYVYLISPAGKSALISRGKEFACDFLLDDPVYVAVTVLQPNACPATKETIFIRKRLGYQK